MGAIISSQFICSMDYDIAENRALVHRVGSYRVREEAQKAAQRMHRLDALQFVFVILNAKNEAADKPVITAFSPVDKITALYIVPSAQVTQHLVNNSM